MGLLNKKKDQVIFDFTKIEAKVNEQIDDYHRKQGMAYAKKEGQGMARKQPAQPLPEAENPHPSEGQMQSMYTSLLNDIDGRYNLSASLEEKKSRTYSLLENYQRKEGRRDVERRRLIESNETKKNVELNGLHLNHQNEDLQLDDQITKKKLKEHEIESDIDNINHELSETNEAHPGKKKNFIHYFILALLISFEFSVNNSAFLAVFRDSVLITYCATLSVGILLVGLAHVAGMFLKRKKRSRTETIMIIASIIGGVTVSMFVGVIRAKALENGAQGMSSFEVSGINFAFFLLGMIISYLFSFRNPELVKQYKSAHSNLKEVREDIAELYEQKSKLVANTSKELTAVEEKYLIDVDSQLDNEFAKLRAEIIQYAKEYNSIYSIAKALYKKVNANYKESISTFRAQNVIHRQDGITPKYFSDAIENLETDLSKHEELSINFNSVTNLYLYS